MSVLHTRARPLARLGATLAVALALGAGAPLGPAPAAAAPAPIPLTSASCPTHIQQGQVSGCATRLQQLLNQRINVGLAVDGDFGPATLGAVRSFQASRALGVDGIVGPQTKTALEGAAPPVLEPGRQRAVSYARAVAAGQAVPRWGGGPLPYSWGGGHAANHGPSLGTCLGYTGSIQPCPADSTVGVDCSGFVRWMYALGFGGDVLGAGNTDSQVRRMVPVGATAAAPGDLVFYGTASNTHHVGLYLGNGQMVNALRTGTNVRIDPVTALGDLLGYYRLR